MWKLLSLSFLGLEENASSGGGKLSRGDFVGVFASV